MGLRGRFSLKKANVEVDSLTQWSHLAAMIALRERSKIHFSTSPHFSPSVRFVDVIAVDETVPWPG